MNKTSDQTADMPTKQVLEQVELQRQHFELTARTFGLQIAFSSFSNALGQVAGHPLDTVRVSFSSVA